jgi:hypothetical protein
MRLAIVLVFALGVPSGGSALAQRAGRAGPAGPVRPVPVRVNPSPAPVPVGQPVPATVPSPVGVNAAVPGVTPPQTPGTIVLPGGVIVDMSGSAEPQPGVRPSPVGVNAAVPSVTPVPAPGRVLLPGGREVDVIQGTQTVPLPAGADPSVVAVQQTLVIHGFLAPADVTGVDDQTTRDALEVFQTSVGLDPTGIVDPLTLEALQQGFLVQPPNIPTTELPLAPRRSLREP